MDNICDICKLLMSDVYVLQLTDDKNKKVAFRGHKNCINNTYDKVKEIDKDGKMLVSQVVKKLGLEVEN